MNEYDCVFTVLSDGTHRAELWAPLGWPPVHVGSTDCPAGDPAGHIYEPHYCPEPDPNVPPMTGAIVNPKMTYGGTSHE